jgi:hypothetical protein
MKLRFPLLVIAVLPLAACVAPLEEYRPVTDPAAKNAGRYESDLKACYAVGKQAEAAYKKREQEQMGANLMMGILVGAAAGAAIGDSSDWAAYGAASGAAAGASATDTELAVGGPRRIIDRCMSERGHKILNDIGRG